VTVGGPDWWDPSCRPGGAQSHPVEVELPGIVLAIQVDVGQRVRVGDEVALLESMKMEIPVLAEVGGLVKNVDCEVGDALNVGDPVVTLTCRA